MVAETEPFPLVTRERGARDCARWYASLGFRVLPLQVGGKTPHGGLLGRGWEVAEIASADLDVIDGWWSVERWANVGLLQGIGTVVGDLDRKHGGRPRRQLDDRCRALGVTLPRGPVVRTPTGEHLHFSLPPGTRLQRVHGYLPDVDLQAGGSYVVAPPSHLLPGTYDARAGLGDPRPPRRRPGWRDPRPWLPYAWTRPEVPTIVDPPEWEPFGADVDPLTADQVWRPTGAELLAALSAAVAPPELLADVAATASLPGRSGGLPGAWRGPVPVDEWAEHGIPAELPHQPSLWLAAASCTGRGMSADETFTVLRRIADVTPLKNPGWPWEDWQLQDMADRAADGLPERRRRDDARHAEWARRIQEGWDRRER